VDLASQAASTERVHDTMPITPAAPVLQDPNNTHEVTQLFLDLYYRRFGPDKTTSDTLQPGRECGGWRALLPHWTGQSPMLDTAIRAMTTCFIGAQYQDETLVDQGRNTYLSSLQMVQEVLLEESSAQRKDLLATTLVMSSTELFLSNGGGGSQLTHVEGANRLLHCMLENQNASAFEDIHVYVFNQGLFECISSRRPYTFSSPAYLPIIQRLYSAHPAYPTNLYFQWCHLILPLPHILHTVDNLVNTATTSRGLPEPNHILETLNELATLEQTLAPWQETFKTSIPGPWTFPTALISAESVPFPLQFVSIEACTLHCLHWTSQLLILDARYMLLSLLPSHMHHALPTPDLQPQTQEYASLICRSVQFCTKGTSFASAENMFLPLHVVASYYARAGDHERKRWCLGASVRIAEEQKIGFAPDRVALLE
jgi:hypothetical protein